MRSRAAACASVRPRLRPRICSMHFRLRSSASVHARLRAFVRVRALAYVRDRSRAYN